MFDLVGLKQMAQDIDTFTRQTGSALAEIASELRIANALMALHMSGAYPGLQAAPGNPPKTPLQIMADATKLAAELATAERVDRGGE